MSKTIVQIVSLKGKVGGRAKALLGPWKDSDPVEPWSMELQIMDSDMTIMEATKALREARQYELVEVFDVKDS